MTLLRVLALFSIVACGSDVTIVVRSSFGTISDDAACDGDDGRFPLREEGGLVVVVLVDDDTTIVAGGFSAGCDDLTAGARASVSGSDEDGRIRADRVEIEG